MRAGFLLHEAVAATIRAGASSAASTHSWLAFLPVSLVFGWLTRVHIVQSAGCLLVPIAAAIAVLLISAAHDPVDLVRSPDPPAVLARSAHSN